MKSDLLHRALELLHDGDGAEAIALLRSDKENDSCTLLAELLDDSLSLNVQFRLELRHRKKSRPRLSTDERIDRRFAAYEAVRQRKPGTKVVSALEDFAKENERSLSSVRVDYDAVRKKLIRPKKVGE